MKAKLTVTVPMGTTKLVDRAVKASGYPNRTALVSEAIRRAIDKARG